MGTDDWTARQASEEQIFLRTATELLHAGRYERLAELLHRVQLSYDRKGDTIPAHVLVLAQRICLACNQSQAEADWHQQVREEATQREEKLRHQLITLLEMVSERDLSVVAGEWDLVPATPSAVLRPPAPDLPESAEPLSLWQRIQGILHWRLGPRSRQQVASEVRVQGLAPTTDGWAEVGVVSPGDAAETPPRPPLEDAHAPTPSPEQVEELATSPPSRREHKTGKATAAAGGTEKEGSWRPPSLAMYCLGSFRVYQDDHLITEWESQKAKCILKYLAAHRGNPIFKDVLMDVFWPEAEPEAARRNLHQAIYSLRQTLRRGRPNFQHIQFESDCYLLNPETRIWLDFEEFEKHVKGGQQLEAAGQLVEAMREYSVAEGLYSGRFLEEDLYEDWPSLQREQIESKYLGIVDRLSKYYLEQAEYTAAMALCQKILAQDNCREEAHRRLMQCYLAQGQRYLAVRQYHTCAGILKEELDLTPSEETIRLYQHITRTM